VDQVVDHISDCAGKLPLQRAYRATSSLDSIRLNQVGNTLRLCKVELVVQEGALREFARLCQPRAQIKAALQKHPQDGGAAVPLQFEHIFAGIGTWCGKKQGDALVKGVAFFVNEIAEGGTPGGGYATQNPQRK
jgi:hypothetical protein